MWTSDEGQKIVLDDPPQLHRPPLLRQQRGHEESSCCPGKNSRSTARAGADRRLRQAPDRTNEVKAIFDREMNLAYLGEKTVKEAANMMKTDIDVVLKRPI